MRLVAHRLAHRFTAHALIVLALALTAVASLDAQKINKSWTGLAIKGYDPVAYFTEGKPVKGDAQFDFDYRGATYRFASAENRERFIKEPEKYLPQFGGFCAYAVSRNYTADTDPLAWRIVDGKLYLNYNRGAQEKWEQDIPGNIKKGDTNWPALSQK
jgi:YHS domain-containing protein